MLALNFIDHNDEFSMQFDQQLLDFVQFQFDDDKFGVSRIELDLFSLSRIFGVD